MRTFHAPHTLYPPADDFAIALARGLRDADFKERLGCKG